MNTKIALAGNPNSGKSTLFNRLTGANQYVGNWPGVTVEKKEGKLKGYDGVTITDLPGIYSLSPYTLEEVVSRTYILDEKPDAVIDVIDGTNLERNLYLADQLRELGVPLVLAVNMMDVVEKQGLKIDLDVLSKNFGVPVFAISALKGTGVDKLVEAAVNKVTERPSANTEFASAIEEALAQIESEALGSVPAEQKRFYAIKLFERDDKIAEALGIDAGVKGRVEEAITKCEKALDDDSESVITSGRYDEIARVMDACSTRAKTTKVSVSDKIDRIVTNRVLGLPIFAVVMFLVYYVSVTTIGGLVTDWTNDGLFGDGWFWGGSGREEYDEAVGEFEEYTNYADTFVAACEEAGVDPDSSSAAAITGTYDAYDDETGENEPVEVDQSMYLEATEYLESNEEPDPADFGPWTPGIPVLIENGLTAINCADWLQALILDGIVAGVGAVLGFIPQMLVLFLLLAILEGCGYMARIAFVLDRVFRRFGLSGKSFIPILIGTGCGIPGVMASRTIENDNDRRMTVMTTTFIPCGAKLPIIALFAGALFGGAWWVAPSAYFLGIAAILCSGIILKKTKMFSGQSAPFVMELPAYHVPTVGYVLRSMWERAWSFIKKAGTIILLATILVWFLSSFGTVDGVFGMVDDQNDSLLAVIGNALAWIFYPMGFVSWNSELGMWDGWESVAATITGLIAKENVVGTFGVLYANAEYGWYYAMQLAFTPITGYALLAFNLLCAPCFAAMGAIRREMVTQKWFWRAIGYECGIAYCTATIIYQIGGLFTGDASFNGFTVVAILMIVAFFYLLFRKNKYAHVTASVSSVKAAGAAN